MASFEGVLDRFVSAPKEALLHLITRLCPFHVDTLDANMANTSAGEGEGPAEPEPDEARRQWGRLLQRARQLELPPNALDAILSHFGTTRVAEITGRTKRVVQKEGDEGAAEFAYERRASGRSSDTNNSERQAFLDGRKRVILCSAAGSAGSRRGS